MTLILSLNKIPIYLFLIHIWLITPFSKKKRLKFHRLKLGIISVPLISTKITPFSPLSDILL